MQVLFDGNPAPLTYVSAIQINAIAPVGLTGKSSTQVQVTYQGLTSNAMAVPVQATAPGIFAADGSGTGGGAILNQDYSLNVRLNPAARGSVVAIYLTGAGRDQPRQRGWRDYRRHSAFPICDSDSVGEYWRSRRFPTEYRL